MSKYFSYFPTTLYKSSDSGNDLNLVTNLMTRFKMQESFKTNSAAYTTYSIRDGDTPEILAHKFYGDVEYHWVILTYNNLMDPQFNWPLEERTLNRYINSKYEPLADTANNETGIVWSRTNIHSYYKELTTSTSKNFSHTQIIQIDSPTYANTVTATNTITLTSGDSVTKSVVKGSKTYFQYEYGVNESLRTIRMLKPEFIFALRDELRRTLS
jgi:hypothetical protein